MSALARIRWLRPDEGGRAAPPPGRQYSTVARFESQTEEEWLKDAWSLVLNLEGSPDESWTQTALVRFLADQARAPRQWLQPHSRFALLEGRRKVAEGTILDVGD
jgi:hypothetical protein